MHKIVRKERSFFEELFIPDYDELTLYSMSYICFLFLLLNYHNLSFGFDDFAFDYESIMITVLFLMFLSGMLLSFYHAFTRRQKTLLEKKLMIIFAGILCGFAGIWGGTFVLLNSQGVLVVFPIWNIINGFMLLIALRGGALSEENVRDENVGFGEVMSGTIIVSFVFLVCYHFFDLNWATTFSICIAWVTTMNSSFNSMLIKQKTIQY